MSWNKAEGIQFAAEILGISSPLKKLEEDRVHFLNEVIKAVHSNLPFQSVSINQREDDRHLPTLDEIKTAALNRQGGLCYSLVVMTVKLLSTFGYDAHFIGADVNGSLNNHVAGIVLNLTHPGSKHLVEINGWPTFEAVPLDFKKESPVYGQSFLQFKFVREGSAIVRYHLKTNHCPMASDDLYNDRDVWRKICAFDITPKDLSYFGEPMTTVHTKPGENAPFLTSFRAVVYKDLKLIAVKDKTLMIENDNHELVATPITNCQEMVETVIKYFPQFTSYCVEKAVGTIHMFD